MAEITEECKISLSPRKSSHSADYTLKVPNFFTLSEYDGTSYSLESPSFEFSNATWRFRFQSRAEELRETGEKSFAIYMVRLNYKIPRQMISYTVVLLNGDDERYKSLADSDVFDESDNRNLMWSPHNDKPSYDTRDTLSLIIHLFDVEAIEANSSQARITIDRNIEMLSQDFKKLLLNGKTHDFTLKVADKEFRVHRDILAVRSPVFEAMLTHDMAEKNEDVIDVVDCDPSAIEQFLIYVYSGKIESLNQDNVLDLYYVSDKYNMSLLKEECSEFIIKSFSPSKVCDIIQLALKHSDTYLLDSATEYLKCHANEVFRTEEWKSFMKENVDAANDLLIKVSEK